MQVQGNVYAVFLNGSNNPVTSLANDAFSCGEVALYDYSSQTFSNFTLTVPSSGLPATTLSVSNAGPGQLSLSWSTNADGFFIESTLSLNDPIWTPFRVQGAVGSGTIRHPRFFDERRAAFPAKTALRRNDPDDRETASPIAGAKGG